MKNRGRVYWVLLTLIVVILLAVFVFAPHYIRSRRDYGYHRSIFNDLRSIVTAQVDFRQNDRDGNRANDFWVADIQGLWAIQTPDGEPIHLISSATAAADGAPKPDAGGTRYEKIATADNEGYRYATLTAYWEEGARVPYDDGSCRNINRFGLVAYPEKYSSRDRWTYIASEKNVVYKKDLEGAKVDTWPKDPEAEGWQKVD